MSATEKQIEEVPWSASPRDAAWFVFQHMGDRDFKSRDEFWRVYGQTVQAIKRGGGDVPFQHDRRLSVICATNEGWLTKRPDGSLSLKLSVPSWKNESEQET
jgi:hypothetical protein